MVKHTRRVDRAFFERMSMKIWPKKYRESIGKDHFILIAPAFMIGQLADAFKIGFLIFLPFVVVDLVVASILMALGMGTLPPGAIALPFKVLLFVMIDGWYLLSKGLVLSYL